MRIVRQLATKKGQPLILLFADCWCHILIHRKNIKQHTVVGILSALLLFFQTTYYTSCRGTRVSIQVPNTNYTLLIYSGAQEFQPHCVKHCTYIHTIYCSIRVVRRCPFEKATLNRQMIQDFDKQRHSANSHFSLVCYGRTAA